MRMTALEATAEMPLLQQLRSFVIVLTGIQPKTQSDSIGGSLFVQLPICHMVTMTTGK
jgi:hypothetical protein